MVRSGNYCRWPTTGPGRHRLSSFRFYVPQVATTALPSGLAMGNRRASLFLAIGNWRPCYRLFFHHLCAVVKIAVFQIRSAPATSQTGCSTRRGAEKKRCCRIAVGHCFDLFSLGHRWLIWISRSAAHPPWPREPRSWRLRRLARTAIESIIFQINPVSDHGGQKHGLSDRREVVAHGRANTTPCRTAA